MSFALVKGPPEDASQWIYRSFNKQMMSSEKNIHEHEVCDNYKQTSVS